MRREFQGEQAWGSSGKWISQTSKEDKLRGHAVLALPQSGMAHNGNSFVYLLKVHGHILLCQPKSLPGFSGKTSDSRPMLSAPAFP